MFFKDVGFLCKEKTTLDKHNRPKISYEESKIYCNVKSIGLTEFYQAQSVGLKPELKIEARLIDLDGVSHFKYNNKLYKVLRTTRKEDLVEIVITSTIINNE